jgi:hypothetical protein
MAQMLTHEEALHAIAARIHGVFNHNAKATLSVLSAAYEADQIDRCGHGKTWNVDCAEC